MDYSFTLVNIRFLNIAFHIKQKYIIFHKNINIFNIVALQHNTLRKSSAKLNFIMECKDTMEYFSDVFQREAFSQL